MSGKKSWKLTYIELIVLLIGNGRKEQQWITLREDTTYTCSLTISSL